mmetsp:Transcript_1147/g.2327  ORF Transcript_1147/g.2327 Transcript_1147/m.2327 type:complete len:345 (-) Transcript_1147:84-1118(-)|eukprot:CAMPEP_0197626144 /NCGR_PEP_ID=MMETSP1338-20131121/5249_1 /TAXON_ID=43686 ORGANISM="Pelagodinium beii, Strain RCC1491" /NCGR_SAMPLE_ID=MMETSP1338 /ASSEMBLY_ACC=CAM_ASM_000754 /LENGTH=344 /DNA_ID=CAMNT_0043196663 /DNA_START=73 /DNA_END=1107 /DNA_ORIENTATION=-
MSSKLQDPETILAVAVFCMLLFGSLNVLVKEALVVDRAFFPLLWNMVTMLGQACLFPLSRCEKVKDSGKPAAPFWVLVAVTSIDLGALSLINSTYNVLPGSIIQMLRGFKVIFTAILSKLVLGKTLESYQIAGIACSCVGLVLAGASSMKTSWNDAKGAVHDHPAKVIFALSVGMASQFAGSCQVVFEAKVMKKYTVEPLKLTGYEGLIGTPIGCGIIYVAYMLGNFNPAQAVSEMVHDPHTAFLLLCFLIFVASFNLSGMFVTKYGSPVLRTMLEITRTAFIWMVEVMFAWNPFQSDQLFAFLAIATGTLLYGNFIKLSIFSRPKPADPLAEQLVKPKAPTAP